MPVPATCFTHRSIFCSFIIAVYEFNFTGKVHFGTKPLSGGAGHVARMGEIKMHTTFLLENFKGRANWET
jgi:hypothetical protein